MSVAVFYLAWFGLGLMLAPLTYASTLGHFRYRFPELAKLDTRADRLFAIQQAGIGLISGPVVPIMTLIQHRGEPLEWR
jgi:hypothetical protein